MRLLAYLMNARRRRNATRLVLSGTPVTTGTNGVPYAGFTVSATGGRQPTTFSVLYGALPGGLTLNPTTGAVEGTPNTPGTFAGITIEGRDTGGTKARLPAFTIVVT